MWGTLTKKEANSIYETWISESKITENTPSKYMGLRNDLKKIFDESLAYLKIDKSLIKNNAYEIDLEFGLRLYDLLTDKYNFNERQAADDTIWIHMSVIIIPDIITQRWNLNAARFFNESRRIWLKTLWWYIHLSWNENIKNTREILINNTTDEIVQLVERAGNNGYRISLTREIMLFYGQMPTSSKKRSGGIFRKVMKLNTARVKVVEPTLYHGGNKQYVKELFNSFG